MIREFGWKHALVLTVLALVVTSLPYTFAYLTTPDDRVFIGVHLNVVDHLQYFSWMRAHEDSFLISDRMTPEPNAPVFFNLFWWAMAQVARVTNWDYPALLQLLRWPAGLVFGLVVYAFSRLCIHDSFKRALAFLLILFVAGFGWILVVQKYLDDLYFPLALYVAEPNSFLALMGGPHFTIAAAHIVGALGLFLTALRRRQLRWAALAGVVALSLGLQHAYDLITVYGVIGAFVLVLMIRERRVLWFEIRAAVIVGLISVGPPAYFFFLTSADPVWSVILDQFVNIGVWTPDPIRLVILMGVLLLLGLAGPLADLWRSRRASPRALQFLRVWLALTLLFGAATPVASLAQSLWPETFERMPVNALAFGTVFLVAGGLIADLVWPRQEESKPRLFVKTWAVVHLFIIYIPLEFQIHLLNPWQVPLAILAASFWLDRVVPLIQARWPRWGSRRAMSALLLLVVTPTNVYLFVWRFVDLNRHDSPFFIYRDEAAALQWLDGKVAADDVVLSSEMIGQFVPGATGGTAFVAHYAMTLDYFGKLEQVKKFFDADVEDAWREALIREYNVRYVYYGRHERAQGDFNPARWSALEPVFSQGETTVFHVTLSSE